MPVVEPVCSVYLCQLVCRPRVSAGKRVDGDDKDVTGSSFRLTDEILKMIQMYEGDRDVLEFDPPSFIWMVRSVGR